MYMLLALSAALASSAEAPVPDVHIHTPLLRSSKLSERVGGPVYLKMDALQPGGSFKARGIGRLCTHLVRERGVTRLVSSSCANAGMAVAVAGRALGVATTIVASDVDRGCRLLESFRRLGAEVLLEGKEWNDADARARALGDEPASAYVPMFDHPLIVDGHSSLVEELFSARKPRSGTRILVSQPALERHVLRCIPVSSAVLTVFLSVVLTRCSQYAAQCRLPALTSAYSACRTATASRPAASSSRWAEEGC